MEDNISITIVLCLSTIAIILSNIIGNIVPPCSILLAPFIIVGLSWILNKKSKISYFYKVLIILFFSLVNDFLIRIYAGGNHDSEGNGIIQASLVVGLAVSFILIIKYELTQTKILSLITGLILSLMVLVLYLINFGQFGMDWTRYPSEDLNSSIKDKVFISELKFSDSTIIVQQDTFTITQGWIEKEIKIDNKTIKKDLIETGRFNVIISIDGLLLNYGYSDRIYYKKMDSTEKKGFALSSIINLNIKNPNDTLSIYFYEGYFIKYIKEIKMVANLEHK
jgi:hypothetical protein